MKRKNVFLATVLIVTMSLTVPTNAAWYQSEAGDRWKWQAKGVEAVERWITDGQGQYYIGTDGYMKSGWMELLGSWFFLDTRHDGFFGKALSGWQWIDGYCYFFDLEGKMLTNTITPDGYHVNEQGVWTVEGTPQYSANKGIMTTKPETPLIRSVSSSGSSGGGSSGGGGGSSKPQNPTYTYTIQYIEIATKSVLQVITGQGKKNDTIAIEFPEFEDYEICEDQKTEFKLGTNNQIIKIYYEKILIASPSDAEQVTWQVYFVEEDNHTNEIFKRQEGKSEEGTNLLVDFPEVILKNSDYYHSVVSSPYRILLYGTGIQKYYIEFTKQESSEEPDPDAPAINRLKDWLDLSRVADEDLTGIISMDGQLITKTTEESNQRLKNLFSVIEDTDRHEIYLIAENHIPSSFIVGQFFPEAINVSELVLDTFTIGADDLVIMKVGFERKFNKDSCQHNFDSINDIEAGCLTNGADTVVCRKCSYSVDVIVPAMGHEDINTDDMCDICYEVVSGNEIPEETYYEIGDMQARLIGNKTYLFRCIDEDYEDGLNNKQQVALFLCETVIRSDIDSTTETLKTMSFGSNNNYKSSTIRSWLQNNATDSLFATHTSYTGIALAYTGATRKGDFDQFDEILLTGKNKPFQLLEDNLFLMSVEEAIKYRDKLWRFNGADSNNPESQYSAYAKGYWLRTPQYQDNNGSFSYGAGAYMVDMVDGNIHTVDVGNKSIGIRPVITVRQN